MDTSSHREDLILARETCDELRAGMKDKEKMPDDCPMSDLVISHAMGELGPGDTKKAKEHLTTCRYCLDLYMDIRSAEEETTAGKDEKVEVLRGLQEAIKKDKPQTVSSWQKISEAISGLFGGGSFLKPVETFATILLVILVGVYVLRDDTPVTPYSIQIMVQGWTQVGFRGGQPEYKEIQVEPGGELKSGDYFRIQTTVDKDAYVYLVFQDSAGEIQSLDKRLITGGTDLFLPDKDKWFRLDQNTGTERIWVLAAKDKIADFEKRVEELKRGGIGNIEEFFQKTSVQEFNFDHK
jgi:hypothetical protein